MYAKLAEVYLQLRRWMGFQTRRAMAPATNVIPADNQDHPITGMSPFPAGAPDALAGLLGPDGAPEAFADGVATPGEGTPALAADEGGTDPSEVEDELGALRVYPAVLQLSMIANGYA